MNKTIDIVALGELLIDFTESGLSPQGNPLLEANPGGAVCNVLSMLSKLGHRTAFIGKVGNDGFGHQLAGAIKKQGILTDGLRFDPVVKTTLAIVLKLPNGDRDFAFYRKPGADVNLTADELDTDLIKNAKVFHFGTLSLTDEPARSATVKAIEIAKENNCLISFDPNLREPLWESLQQAKIQFDYGFKQADFVKISDNEIQWFTNEADYDKGVEFLLSAYPNIKLLCLSLGPDGSRAYYKGKKVEANAFLQEATIETTGAGDTFCASMIHVLLQHGIDDLSIDQILEGLIFANAAASLVTTKKGALSVMPTAQQVHEFILERGKQ